MAFSIDVELAEDEITNLIDRAIAGEEVILTRAGRPIARIVALPYPYPPQPGLASHWEIDEALLAPTDPEELDWSDGESTDALEVAIPRRS